MKKLILLVMLFCSIVYGANEIPTQGGNPSTWGTDLNNYLQKGQGWADVRAFGTTGKGIVDDTDEIQAAIDSLTGGGTVFLPPGDYLISAPLILTTAHNDPSIRFMGSGTGRLGDETLHVTRIINNANTDALVYRSNGGVIIENLTIFDSFGSRTAGAGILGERTSADGVVSAHIRDVVIQGHQDGIRIVRGQQTIIENVVAMDAVRDCFRVEDNATGSGTSITFRNCFANEAGNDGFSLLAHTYILYENCSSDNSTRYGYFVDNGIATVASAVTYLACGAENPTDDGWRIGDSGTGAFAVQLVGCWANGSGADGVQIDGVGLTITGGKFTGNTGYGINNNSGVRVVAMNVELTSNSAGEYFDNTGRLIFINPPTENSGMFTGSAFVRSGSQAKDIGTLANDGTPTVLNDAIWLTGGTATITDFDDGVTGQTIIIIGQHSTTQVTDGGNLTLAGSNFVMDSGDTITLVSLDGTEWLELSRSNNN